MARLLQQDNTCKELGGVSVGGWITLSLLFGTILGVACTLVFQCWRRRKELRYMDRGPPAHLIAIHALPTSTMSLTPMSCHQQAMVPAAAAAPAAPATPVAGNKYYSPLNSNKGPAALVHAQLSELRSSLRLSENGGDTLALATSDQQAPRNKNDAFSNHAAQQQAGIAVPGATLSSRPRDFSQHGMRQQCYSSSHGNQAWNSAMHQAPPPNAMAAQGNVSARGHELPQEISSSLLSADGQLHSEDSMPHGQMASAAGVAAGQHVTPGGPQGGTAAGMAAGSQAAPASQSGLVHGQAVGDGADSLAACAGDAGAAVSAPVPSSSGGVVSPKRETSTAAHEIEDEYEVDDLDDDWRALLGNVDSRLRQQGALPMDARERSIAIKKLLVATGTRGVEHAMTATLQEVLHFRRMHGS